MYVRPTFPWLTMITLMGLWTPMVAAPVSAGDLAPWLGITPEPGGGSQQTADQLLHQGLEQYKARQVPTAVQSWQQALTLYRQFHNLEGEGLAIQYLGEAYLNQGNYQQATVYYQQQQTWARQTNNRLVEARALGNLGLIARALGNYAQAEHDYQEALKLFKGLNDLRSEGQILANLGNLQATLGNYEQAIAYQQSALTLHQQLNNPRASILSQNSLGTYYAAQANYQVAQTLYEQALQAARQIGFQAAEANALNSLGTIAHSQSNFQEAIAYYQKALAIAQAIPDVKLQAAALGGLGLALTNQRNYSRALDYQKAAIDAARQLRDPLLEANLLNNLSYTWFKSGNLQAAEQSAQATLTLLESLRTDLSDADKVSIFDTQVRSYNTLQRILVARKQPEAALVATERGRARAFVELLSQRLSTQAAQELAVSPTVQPPTLAEIRQITRTQNATLVQYAIIPDEDFLAQGKLKGKDAQLFIWVIQPDGTIHFRRFDLTHLKHSLAELVADSQAALGVRGLVFQENQDIVSALAEQQSSTDQNANLRQLHQILIEPIADLLPSTPEQPIIMIPQGPLFLVPFAALQDQTGQYLIENHTILTAPAIQVLALTHRQAQTVKQRGLTMALVVGNPEMPWLGNPPKQLTSLKGAENEAKAIAKLLNTQPILGKAATKVAIQQQMANARIIHLATHGLLHRIDPWGQVNRFGTPGAIALAPSEHDGGFLTANEILNLRLNAELVVLSACDTGRGDITGDGVIGLSRALIAAGVPSVVVSLWQVPDAPTEFLMIQFYRNLQNTTNKAEALRQAMLTTMRDYPDPKDWAAFTLIGESN